MSKKGNCYNCKHHLFIPTDIEDGYDCFCMNEEAFNKHYECCDSNSGCYDWEICDKWCQLNGD